MLNSWASGTISNKPFLAYSFADRSNISGGEAVVPAVSSTALHELGSIAEGLLAGTLVATELGWQRVEDLHTGDRVVTFDNGMRRLKSVRLSTLWTKEQLAPRKTWLVDVPKGVLGNRTQMQILPEQTLLIESDSAEALFGDPFAMVPASALEGYKGIARVPPQPRMTVVALEFDGEEVVYANGTTLVHCANDRVEMVRSAEEMMLTGTMGHYPRLPLAQGRRLVEAMRLAG